MSRNIHRHLKENGFLVPERSPLQVEFGLTDDEFCQLNHKMRNRIINNLYWSLRFREADRLKQIYQKYIYEQTKKERA